MGFDIYGFLVFSAAVLSNFMEKCHGSASEGGCAGIFVQSTNVCLCCFAFLGRLGFVCKKKNNQKII